MVKIQFVKKPSIKLFQNLKGGDYFASTKFGEKDIFIKTVGRPENAAVCLSSGAVGFFDGFDPVRLLPNVIIRAEENDDCEEEVD